MKEIIKCDTAVLATLRKARKQEQDFLVDVITDHGGGRIGLSSSIKDLLLREKQEQDYTADGLSYLVREFQAFGGHSVANLFRSEPLAYDEILTDVHKKLNGSNSKNKSVSEKEKEIVLGLFGQEWLTLPDRERFDRSTSTKVKSGLFKLSDNLQVDEKGIVSNVGAAAAVAGAVAARAIPAVAIASSAIFIAEKSLGEAYRVTVPFVAQVAWIRMRLQLSIK